MQENEIRYPNVHVELSSVDGNAFAIMGAVGDAVARHLRANTDKTAQEIQAERDAYMAESQSGDYDHLVQTAMRWVRVS